MNKAILALSWNTTPTLIKKAAHKLDFARHKISSFATVLVRKTDFLQNEYKHIGEAYTHNNICIRFGTSRFRSIIVDKKRSNDFFNELNCTEQGTVTFTTANATKIIWPHNVNCARKLCTNFHWKGVHDSFVHGSSFAVRAYIGSDKLKALEA